MYHATKTVAQSKADHPVQNQQISLTNLDTTLSPVVKEGHLKGNLNLI